MIRKKSIGIWMNHSIAHIMEFAEGVLTSMIIESAPKEPENRFGNLNNESLCFYNEQYFEASFFKKLEACIMDCNEVVLFGPTYSKVKLYYALKTNKRFANTRIGITQTENMSITEQKEFVMSHFSKPYAQKQQYINN